MSSTIAFTTLLLLALLALTGWIVLRLRVRRLEEADDGGDKGARRFDTTMGELRDLREALGGKGARHPDRPE